MADTSYYQKKILGDMMLVSAATVGAYNYAHTRSAEGFAVAGALGLAGFWALVASEEEKENPSRRRTIDRHRSQLREARRAGRR